jgi:hypothetical protein
MTAGFQASPADKKPGAMQMSEKEFVTMMLQHHQDGIEMARIAEQKATTADVKSLAKKIREGQAREAQEMKPFAEGTAATPQGTSGQQHQAHAAEHQAHMQESKNAIERVRKASGKAHPARALGTFSRVDGKSPMLDRSQPRRREFPKDSACLAMVLRLPHREAGQCSAPPC